jgi:flagellar basal-body rod modification protein FlgD
MINTQNRTTGSSAPNPNATTGEAGKKKSEVSKDVFMQLLVAQVKNQDPLKPTDGVQFLTQLAQFTELEQMAAMRTDIGRVVQLLTPTTEGQNGTGSNNTRTGGEGTNV